MIPNACSQLFSMGCFDALWARYEGLVSVAFTARDIVLMIAGLIVALVIRRYFTTEPEKREAFWGIVPTLIVPVVTPAGKFLLIKKAFTEPDGSLHDVYMFPQRVMLHVVIESEVEKALQAEVGLAPNHFQLLSKDANPLGTRRVKGLEKPVPSTLGFCLFRKSRGRSYRWLAVKSNVEEHTRFVQKDTFPWVTRETALYVGDRKLASERVDGFVLVDKAKAMQLVLGSHTGPRREGKIPFFTEIFNSL